MPNNKEGKRLDTDRGNADLEDPEIFNENGNSKHMRPKSPKVTPYTTNSIDSKSRQPLCLLFYSKTDRKGRQTKEEESDCGREYNSLNYLPDRF